MDQSINMNLGADLRDLPSWGLNADAPGTSSLHLFGTNGTKSRANEIEPLVGGAGDMTVYGTEPTYSSNFMTTADGVSGGLQLPSYLGPSFSAIFIARTNIPFSATGGGKTLAQLMGDTPSLNPTLRGMLLAFYGTIGPASSRVRLSLMRQDGSSTIQINVELNNNGLRANIWQGYSVRVTAGSGAAARLKNLSDANLAAQVTALPSDFAPVLSPGVRPVIGTALNSLALSGPTDIAAYAISPTAAWSDEEEAAQWAQVRALAAGRGVDV